MVLCVVPKGEKTARKTLRKEEEMHITEITPKIAQKAEKIRLAPYCRVSSDSADQMHSFATQIRYYSEYAKKKDRKSVV